MEKKRDIMRRYDASACIYEGRYREEQEAKYKAALEELRTGELGAILDAGCGTGLLFDFVKDKATRIVGLDFSLHNLKQARKRADGLSGMDLICADVDAMPFREITFDHVFAFTLLQNSPTPLRTLQEIIRVSKPKSIIIVTGLRKLFSRSNFKRLLRVGGLRTLAFRDEDCLKCYVAVCTQVHH